MHRPLVAVVAGALAPFGGHVVAAHGVRLEVPTGWSRVASAGDGPVTDPRTLLVVGTRGVRPHRSACQIAAYRLPARAGVVVIVGWKTANGDRGPGRAALATLVAVRPRLFECFEGRGASATIVVRGRQYQVNVMVGERASSRVVSEALGVARSFDVVR